MVATNVTKDSGASESAPGSADIRDKVPVHEKAAWAAGGASDAIMTTSIGQLALPIYNMGLGLDARMVGLAVALPRFLDAFLDPIMGNISDNARTRWGRRRPFIFVGGILVTLFYWLTWCPPRAWSPTAIFLYLVVSSCLFFLFYTLYLIPHAALGFELSGDYNERTRIMAYRSFFGSVGGLALPYFLMWSQSKLWGGNSVDGIRWVTGIAAVVMMFGILASAIFCKERVTAQAQEKIKMLSALRLTMTNKPFLNIIVVIMLVIVACFLVGPFEIYVITHHVAGGDEVLGAKIFGNVNFVYGILGICMTPIISYVATRIGKKAMLMVGEGMAMLSFLSTLLFYQSSHPYLILISKFFLNPGLTSVWILGFAMIADVCDYDELQSGLRREGMFGAMYNTIVIKIGISLVTAVSGYCVAWSGYVPKVKPSLEVVNNLRYTFAIVPAALLALALIITAFYPLTERRVRQIRNDLQTRKAMA